MTTTIEIPYDPSEIYESNKLVELTQSAISTFMRCPQRYVLQYLMLVVRRSPSISLLVGSAVHKGFEILLANNDDVPIDERQPAIRIAIDGVFEKVVNENSLFLGLSEKQLETGRAQAHACLEAWFINSIDLLMESWKLIESEMRIRTAKNVTLLSSLVDRFAGQVDGLIENNKGELWILEHKTRSRLDTLDEFGLVLDTQALFYIMMVRLKQKQDVKGFLYNAIQKPLHRMNANGFDDLKNRMLDAMVTTPDKYFSLSEIPIGDTGEAFINFSRIIAQMDALNQHNVVMHTTACDDFGGCPYKTLCKAGANARRPLEILDMAEMATYEFKSHPHVELEEEKS